MPPSSSFLFFFNDTATTEIYTLSLHDALPICHGQAAQRDHGADQGKCVSPAQLFGLQIEAGLGMAPEEFAGQPLAFHADRKSTRLNSSHVRISYAVFCLKKKKTDLLS